MLNYSNILVPIDFSDISISALEKAARHSDASGSRLFVAHISPSDTLEESRGTVEREALKEIDKLLNTAEVGYSEKIVGFGDTVPTLLDIISNHHIDLVVMGTHHFNSFSNEHSVTKDMGESIECDILILHK